MVREQVYYGYFNHLPSPISLLPSLSIKKRTSSLSSKHVMNPLPPPIQLFLIIQTSQFHHIYVLPLIVINDPSPSPIIKDRYLILREINTLQFIVFHFSFLNISYFFHFLQCSSRLIHKFYLHRL